MTVPTLIIPYKHCHHQEKALDNSRQPLLEYMHADRLRGLQEISNTEMQKNAKVDEKKDNM